MGGGDSFASGLIFGLLDGQPLQTALEYGAAHGALAMTTPGDTSMALALQTSGKTSGSGVQAEIHIQRPNVRHVLIAKQQPWHGTTYDGETPLEAAEDLPDFNEH